MGNYMLRKAFLVRDIFLDSIGISKCDRCGACYDATIAHIEEDCENLAYIHSLEHDGYIRIGHDMRSIISELNMSWLKSKNSTQYQPSHEMLNTLEWLKFSIKEDFKLIEVKAVLSNNTYALVSKNFNTSHEIVLNMLSQESTYDDMEEYNRLQEYKTMISNIFL